MPQYPGPGFTMSLPEGYRDLSTFAFVFPGAGEFQPSIVVKMEKREGVPPLRRYATDQLSIVAKSVEDLKVISQAPTRQGSFESFVVVFEWGPPTKARIRQMQIFIAVPAKSTVYTLTATNLAANFDETESLFNAVMASFAPK